MPKRKKTRKQKTLADVRRQNQPMIRETMPSRKTTQSSHIQKEETPSPVHSTPLLMSEYQYLSHDLRKALMLTACIIGIEIAIKLGTNL